MYLEKFLYFGLCNNKKEENMFKGSLLRDKKADLKDLVIVSFIIIMVIQGVFIFNLYKEKKKDSREPAAPSLKLAVESLKKDKETESNYAKAISVLSQARKELTPESYQNSIDFFANLSIQYPDNYLPIMMAAWGYYNKAYRFNEPALYEAAIKKFNKALELTPNNYYSYDGLGWIYTRLQNYRLALENFDKALKLNPLDHTAVNGKAFVFKQMGLLNKSIEFSNEAIRLHPTEPDYYSVLGWTYHELGMIPESKGQFSKALVIEPEDYVALNGMAWDLDHEDNFDEALQYAQKSVDILPNYQNYEALGRAYYGKRDYQKSIESIYKELPYLSNNSLLWNLANPYSVLGWSHYRLRDFDNAIKNFQAHLTTREDLRVRLGLVSALYLQGRAEEAALALETALGKELGHGYESGELHELHIVPNHLDHHGQRLARYSLFLECTNEKVITPELISSCVESNKVFGI